MRHVIVVSQSTKPNCFKIIKKYMLACIYLASFPLEYDLMDSTGKFGNPLPLIQKQKNKGTGNIDVMDIFVIYLLDTCDKVGQKLDGQLHLSLQDYHWSLDTGMNKYC